MLVLLIQHHRLIKNLEIVSEIYTSSVNNYIVRSIVKNSLSTTSVTYNDYKYKLNNLSPISYINNIGVDIIKSRLLNAKVHYMVGALDNNPADTSMGKSAE